MKHTRVIGQLVLLGCVGCLEGPTPSDEKSSLSVVSVSASDALGNETPLQEIVRRPVLELLTNVDLNPLEPPIFVFDGHADNDLIEDLTQPPLRIANEKRLLASTISFDQTRARIVLSAPLAAEQEITLALATWTVGSQGERWWNKEEPFVISLRVTSDPHGGAAAIASWPATGASGVAPNLAYAAIGFDGEVETRMEHLQLRSADDADTVNSDVSSIDCGEVGLVAQTCLRLVPERALQTATRYDIELDGWIDTTGSPIETWSTRFTTAAALDTEAPRVTALPCALDEIETSTGCALIGDRRVTFRMATDEPALITWSTIDCAPHTIAAFGAEAEFALHDLQPDGAIDVHFELADAAGNRGTWIDTITTPPPFPTVTITEVRFDPAGPEPKQEYVELFNFGAFPIDLNGYSITDDVYDDGDVIERSVILHPGGRVLLVSDQFDPQDPRDVAPAAGVLLVRIGTSLANGGLSNGGEALFLRDEVGNRISETPGVASVGGGSCLERIAPNTRDGSIGSFVHDATRPCTPGL